MNKLKTALKSQKITISEFGNMLALSRMAATRIVSGKRFKTVRGLFLKIYEITRLTPNDILGIPPQEGQGKE
jgi:transcriptional regulator with XRE-family HTH domain